MTNPEGAGKRGRGAGRPKPAFPPPGYEPPKAKWEEYYDSLLDDPIETPEIPVFEQGLSASEADDLRAIMEELSSRHGEALRLYEPMPEQSRFHESHAPTRIVIGGNRGGKTLSTMVEIARAATGQDPYGKYSTRDLVIVIVGKNLKHIGNVIYPLLFKRGAFKVIRDPVTKKMRAFHPGDEWDEAHRLEAKPAPPLIPHRFYKASSISWEDKRYEIPKAVTFSTGSKILFYSGEAEPPQGMTVDLADFDEEIVHPKWYVEVNARLLDRRIELENGKFLNGRFIWGATPQSGTQHLYDISEKAENQKDDENPSVSMFHVSLLTNTHMTEQSKREFIKAIEDNEDEYNVRVLGHFAIAGSRVYPEFSPKGVHGCESFSIPDSWTRYTITDPGRQVCAVMFVAVPPPSVDAVTTPDGREVRVKGRKIIYGELYIKKCNATIYADRLKGYVGTSSIYAQYIDYRAGRIHEMGSGITIERRYSEALKKVRFSAEKTGHGYIWAPDAVKEGIEAFRNGLHVKDGISEWLVFHDRCPNLLTEAKRYCYKKIPTTNTCTDEPLQRDNHLMDCFDEQTEVLTAGGWKRFSDLVECDSLGTVNLGTDAIEYQTPTELIVRPFGGDMVQIKGRKLDALVTPNHRMVVYKQGKTVPEIRLAKELNNFDRIKLHAKWEGRDYDKICGIDAGDFCEMLGWYVAEGWRYRHGPAYEVSIAQIKPESKAHIRSLLSRLPWHWYESKVGFVASCKSLYEMIGRFECGKNCYEKAVPKYLQTLSPRLIDRFLDGCTGGDGWRQHGRRTISTTSKVLADGLQELFIKIGKSASIREVQRDGYKIRGRSGSNCVLQYWISEWNVPNGVLRDGKNKPNFKPVHYSGMVYCATVPNGTLIVRRNGKPMIAGNCCRYAALAKLVYHKTPQKKHKPGTTMALLEAKKAKAKRDAKGSNGGATVKLW